MTHATDPAPSAKTAVPPEKDLRSRASGRRPDSAAGRDAGGDRGGDPGGDLGPKPEPDPQPDPEHAPKTAPDPHRYPGAGPVVWTMIGLCVAVEALLLAADAQLIGSPRWRGLAYQYGGFWAGLLGDWRPNYAAQPVVMFATYALLHGGLGHLVGNMVTLYALGRQLRGAIGQGGVALVYGVSALGGALAFAALNTSPNPMVGASGALFGMAGALVLRDGKRRRLAGEPLWPVLRVVVLLVALNVILWLWMDGRLAWEAHLGGFVSGAIILIKWPYCRQTASQ